LQLANGAAYIDEKQTWREVHDVKLQALESIVEETNGAPLLVAYHFKSDLERLQKAFPKGRVLDTSPDTINLWNKGKIPLLFAHPASAGHGLNLQDGGHHIVFFSHWWNLEEYQQIIERIGPTRQMQAGHKRAVYIHNIIARDTMDEIVMERRDTKKEVQDLLLEAMKRKPKS
jgi:SNF2 family DNA or RNA helicase